MLTRSVVKALFVYILLIALLAFVLVMTVKADDYWEEPKVTRACGVVTVYWDRPPVPPSQLGLLSGSIWADDKMYELVSITENPPTTDDTPIFEAIVPLDAHEFHGLVKGDRDDYAAVIDKQPIRCYMSWLPLQLNR